MTSDWKLLTDSIVKDTFEWFGEMEDPRIAIVAESVSSALRTMKWPVAIGTVCTHIVTAK